MFKKTDDIVYDEEKKLNRYQKLKNETLGVANLINDNYTIQYPLNDETKDILRKYISSRNTIHFLMSNGLGFSKSTLDENQKLLAYFNDNIIPWQHRMTDEAKRDSKFKHSII